MPFGIHFVKEAENPVGFWLWRIATEIQDAQEYAGEAVNLDEAVNARKSGEPAGKQKRRPFIRGGLGLHRLAVEQSADHALAHTAGLPALLAEAQRLAEGKDAHDAETIAALQKVCESVSASRSAAKADSDSGFDDVF